MERTRMQATPEGDRGMLRQAIAVEHVKFLRYRVLWIGIALIAVLYAVNAVIWHEMLGQPLAAGTARDLLLWPNGLYAGVRVVGSVSDAAPLLVALVGALSGQEYGWRVLHLLFGQGLPRATFLAARLAVIVTVAGVLVAAVMLSAALVCAGLSVAARAGVDPGQVEWGRLLVFALLSVYAILPYGALALMLAIVTRSAIAAVGVGLTVTLLLESLLASALGSAGGALASLAHLLPRHAGISLVQAVQQAGVPQRLDALDALQPVAAASVIAVYVIAFALIAVLALRRQDLT